MVMANVMFIIILVMVMVMIIIFMVIVTYIVNVMVSSNMIVMIKTSGNHKGWSSMFQSYGIEVIIIWLNLNISSDLIWHHLILSDFICHLISSYLISTFFTWYYLNWFDLIWSYWVTFDPMLFNLILSCLFWSHLIWCHPITSNQSDPIPYYLV